MFTLIIVGILLGLGVPSLQGFVLDSRLTADVNAFFGSIQLARSEAAKRGRSVILCKTSDRTRCGGNEIEFDAGWMVFVNEDDLWPPTRSASELLLYAYDAVLEQRSIVSNRPLYEFRAYQRRSTNGTVTFCDSRGAAAARAVIVSYTGRPRVARVGASKQALNCVPLP
jgi:type IV fimbrial biogenesis protein FimT